MLLCLFQTKSETILINKCAFFLLEIDLFFIKTLHFIGSANLNSWSFRDFSMYPFIDYHSENDLFSKALETVVQQTPKTGNVLWDKFLSKIVCGYPLLYPMYVDVYTRVYMRVHTTLAQFLE